MTDRIVLASGNQGKLNEFNEILSQFQIEVVPQSLLNVDDADETGLTFVENAIIKARHACEATGLPALADDSGLEVDALNGAPGIYSARFSGPDKGDQANNAKLLESLANVAEPQRTARYRCVLVYMRHAKDPMPLICQGTLEGRILEAPQGSFGFGYDPLFLVEGTDQTAAQLSPQEKHRISHRGKAVKQFLAQIDSYL
ncbi:RdgB/HAM1 family non-canonical purine NTP pyrophosphatase [Neptunomonas phycophila]|uniref:RdgB/HAM1 family non-canonical purine NTP pyrophosphatase n=1 Tax=Neptunomonas phycophila TaxID=1572645 RepID=UPI001BED05FD|nr:RdgB/HAM1 family non-canonical purine NTP pyrophosphatase [Neptunomonas phycophila]MBT3144635.1 RdgB/HAM1 family non-canonical purine NTP pyrophosphatase [Neptunomonas phycophila]